MAVDNSPLSAIRPLGQGLPRISPPTPVRSDLDAYLAIADQVGIDLMPWQRNAARYLEALGPGEQHLYREVAVIVARQNGKSQLLIPLIIKRLLAGHRVMHTAQDRSLPREIYGFVAEWMLDNYSELFPTRSGRVTKPRYANGTEEVRLTNGGVYSIVAPNSGGARGPSRDVVIIDELREMDTWDFIAAAKPTMTTSRDPQLVYLSNMGEESSVVLNAVTARAGKDESLAYLEWSAMPGRLVDDPVGWSEANPAMGYERGQMGSVYETLVADLRTARLENTLPIFEIEHLCRRMPSTQPKLVPDAVWNLCQGDTSVPEGRPAMAFNMAPDGSRASAALSWPMADGRIALVELADVTGDPIDVDAFGKDLKALSVEKRVRKMGFASWTDAALARHLPRAEAIDAKEYAAATSNFVSLVQSGRLVWDACADVTSDLAWTSRKPHDNGTYIAVPATPERPVPAILAAIRATWLASAPKPAAPRIG